LLKRYALVAKWSTGWSEADICEQSGLAINFGFQSRHWKTCSQDKWGESLIQRQPGGLLNKAIMGSCSGTVHTSSIVTPGR